MKKIIILLIMIMVQTVFSQFKKDEGVAIIYLKNIEATFGIYEVPLRINQVQSQRDIDYTKYEGLIQSFFSASNREWALSEYLDRRTDIVRDEEHFNAVKNNDTSKNYIQIEAVYEYVFEGRDMAFIKYSYIIEKIPFPIIGILSIEKADGIWYISDLLNQEYMITILSNFEPTVLLELLQGKSEDIFIKDLISNTRRNNESLDFNKLFQIYNKWSNDGEEEKLKKLKDKRLIIKDYESPIAKLDVKLENYKIDGVHSFILEKSFFSEYLSENNKLIDSEKNRKKYEGKPEFNLISKDTIALIHKFSFEVDNEIYSIIKYKSKNLIKSVLLNKTGLNYTRIDNQFENWLELFQMLKTQTFYELYQEKITDNVLNNLKKEVFTEGGILNIDKLAQVLKENQSGLSKYLEE